jgi:hypothetical protein
VPHRFLRSAHRVMVGSRERQVQVLNLTIMNGGATDLVLDEMGYRGDVDLITFGAARGIQPTGTVHGHHLFDVVRTATLRPLLGLPEDEALIPDGQISGHFGTAIEVHGKGRYRIHPDTDASVRRLLDGQLPDFIDARLEIQHERSIGPVRQLKLDAPQDTHA